ncbi:MAG: hypothetical protein U0T83_00070 [Bacteriovoracaceae bacterium]
MSERSFIKRNGGQALTEYIFILSFIALIGTKMTSMFSTMMADSIGNLAFVLSSELTVGVCKDNCFFDGYKN